MQREDSRSSYKTLARTTTNGQNNIEKYVILKDESMSKVNIMLICVFLNVTLNILVLIMSIFIDYAQK